MAAVLPFIQVASAAVSLAKSLKKPKTPQGISYDEALTQARGRLEPLFEQEVDRTMENLTRDQISRGFYGQLPADEFTASRIGQLRTDQAGQIANLASAIQGQSQEYALQAAAQAEAEKQNQVANLMGISGAFGDMARTNYEITGEYGSYWPWGKPAQLAAQPVDVFRATSYDAAVAPDYTTPQADNRYRPYLSEW